MEYEGSDIIEKPSLYTRLQHAWNAFRNKDPSKEPYTWTGGYGSVSTSRSDRIRPNYTGSDQTIINAIYNRIATDAASVIIHHCRLDEMDGFVEEIPSGLNECLTVSANVDQTGRSFIQDLVYSTLEEGVVAVVPVDTSVDPNVNGSFDILSLRVGKITQWWPRRVQIELYNDNTGLKEYVILEKTAVAIIENPFYATMNEPNSILKRLNKALRLMDVVDEQISSGKLDLIIQLPYVTKSETRKKQAETRRKEVEDQLTGSKYGIAYIDGTEHITQLNRPVENNFLSKIEFLTRMLYSQLGITEDILNGTASEDTMTNYYKRTIDVILTAIVDEFNRKFLTKTARTQRQKVTYYRNPFSLTPTNAIADIADKFTRNEILSPNEVRSIVGFKPAIDPKADELRNRNISQSNLEVQKQEEEEPVYEV